MDAKNILDLVIWVAQLYLHIIISTNLSACGSAFSTNHAMICPAGGFPTVRHNELRDITASLLSEVWPLNPDCNLSVVNPITHRAAWCFHTARSFHNRRDGTGGQDF